ncbi:PTS glucose transporter subunit IIA [Rheinheimera muenzenbergensis]|uniref:PTS glucose transporter subunit IIA n=1 Tax=Rheinheimera muenzenbergensis TaxID=1193628 RepID=A0ABU8C8P0_9GAMM
MITWHSTLSTGDGIAISSPLTGYVLPITSHPDLLYNANVLTAALCIQLTQGTLLAPFNGVCELSLLYHRRITIKHRSGLTLAIELGCEMHSRNIAQWQTNVFNVVAGQPILAFDLPANRRQKNYATVMISPPQSVNEISTSQRAVTAGVDALLVLQKNI